MHVLFVHQNFPAQFGHVADHLAQHGGFRCTFVSREAARCRRRRRADPVPATRGGATEHNHYCSRDLRERRLARPRRLRGPARPGPTSSPTCRRPLAASARRCSCRELYPTARSSTTSSTSTTARDSRHGLPPRVPRRELDLLRARCPQRHDPARPGELRRRLQPDALAARALARSAPRQGPRHLRRHRHRRLAAAAAACPDAVGDRDHPGDDADRHLRVARLRVDARLRRLHAGRPRGSVDGPPGRALRWSPAATASATAATRSSPAARSFKEHGSSARTTTTCRSSSSSAWSRRRSWRELFSLSDLHIYLTVPVRAVLVAAGRPGLRLRRSWPPTPRRCAR